MLPIQGNVYMLVADGTNITASVGRDGIAIVNTGSPQMTDKILAALTELSRAVVSPQTANNCFGANCPGIPSWSSPYYNAVVSSPRPAPPVRYIINTSAAPENIGGNAKLAASAQFRRAGTGSFGGATRSIGETATIVAHENVLSAMSSPKDKATAAEQVLDYVPGTTFTLHVATSAPLDIVFARGEQVAQHPAHRLGGSAVWQVDEHDPRRPEAADEVCRRRRRLDSLLREIGGRHRVAVVPDHVVSVLDGGQGQVRSHPSETDDADSHAVVLTRPAGA